MEIDNLKKILNNSNNESLESEYKAHNAYNQNLYPNYFIDKNEYNKLGENNYYSQRLKDNIKPKMSNNTQADNNNNQNISKPELNNITDNQNNDNNDNSNNSNNLNNQNNNLTNLISLLSLLKNGINSNNILSLLGNNNPFLNELLKSNLLSFNNNKKNVTINSYTNNEKISSYKRIL